MIAIQWLVAGRELWKRRRLLITVSTLATLYLGACDALALGHGHLERGLYAGPLPLEEFLFYGVTNVMAVQGFVMIAGYLRERRQGP